MKFFILFAMIIACILGVANACSGIICAVNMFTGEQETFKSDCDMDVENIQTPSKFQNRISNIEQSIERYLFHSIHNFALWQMFCGSC